MAFSHPYQIQTYIYIQGISKIHCNISKLDSTDVEDKKMLYQHGSRNGYLLSYLLVLVDGVFKKYTAIFQALIPHMYRIKKFYSTWIWKWIFVKLSYMEIV